MHNVGIYCLLQCQCQFILVNLIHSTCLYPRAENMRMNCHCWLHSIKLFFRTSIAISDSRGELPDPPLDLRVELVVDHGVQAAPVLALDTLAQHPGSYVSKLSLVRRALRLNHQSPAVFLHHQSVTVVSFAWPLPRLSKESFNIFTRRSLCQAACFAKL